MLIKKSLSWEYMTSTYHLVFPGYYDTRSSWKSFQECLVNKRTVVAVLQALAKEKRAVGPPIFDGDQVHVTVRDRTLTLAPETVQYEKKMLTLYRLRSDQLGLHSFFNFSASNDDRLFSFEDVYDAILTGARDAFNAAAAGKNTIDGLSLPEYAWAYTQRQEGS